MQNFLELICLLHVIACAVFLGFNTENQSWLVITLMQKFLELICLLHVIACAAFFGRIKIWKWLVETDIMGIKIWKWHC